MKGSTNLNPNFHFKNRQAIPMKYEHADMDCWQFWNEDSTENWPKLTESSTLFLWHKYHNSRQAASLWQAGQRWILL